MELVNQITEQRTQRAKCITDARAIAEKAVKEERNQTPEEVKQCEELLSNAKGLQKTFEASEKVLEAERTLDETAGRKIAAGNLNDDEAKGVMNVTEEYKKAFKDYVINKDSATIDALKKKSLQQDLPTSGGYLVPDGFEKKIIATLEDLVYIRAGASKFRTDGVQSLGFPTLTDDPSDPDWTGEISPAVSEDTSMKFGKRELKPNLLSKLLKISKLLTHNASYAMDFILSRLGYKFSVAEEKAFLLGTGDGQPLGLMTPSNMGISTGRDISTGNTTTSITIDGVINTRMSLKAQYRKNASWFFHRDAVKQLMLLKDSNGQYIWQPSVQAGEPDRLYGDPVTESEFMPNTFTAGEYIGLYTDLSYYYIADTAGMEMQVLNEKYAETNQVGYIGRKYTDGMPVLEEASARMKLADS